MRPRLGRTAALAVLACACLSCRAASGQTEAEAPPRAESTPPRDLRLVAPRYVADDEAAFAVEVSSQAARVPMVLVVRGADRTVTEASVPPPEGPATRSKDVRRDVSLGAADWPDGRYVAEVRPAEDDSAEPWASVEFRVVREALRRHWQGETRDEIALWIAHANRFQGGKFEPLPMNLERLLDAPAGPVTDLRGILLRSYFSPQLRRRQPYTVYVPEAYDPAEAMPLMILLHGSGYDYLNIFSDIRNGQEFETNPVLVANAGAFRQQEFRHMALKDVEWIIEDMKRKYHVDADRVYCQGISLGGRGTMELAALRPDLFAAISPQGVYGIMQEPNDLPFYLWQDPWSQWSVARWDFRSYLPNLRHVPMQIIYGFKDKTTPPLNALVYRHLVNKRFGGQAEAIGFDRDHHISYPDYKWSDTRAWFLAHRRVKDPPVVTARTATLRFNRFYWVTIEAMEVQWQMAEVSARLRRGRLDVETRNVARLTLDPPGAFDVLRVDGGEVALGRRLVGDPGKGGSGDEPADGAEDPARDRLRLARTEAVWHLLPPDEPPVGGTAAGLVRRHGVSGPIWDVLHGRCIAAYGTGGSATEGEALKAIASRIARLDAAWGEPSWPIVADTEVTDDERRTANLMLVGDARSNALLAGRKWPFDLEGVGRGEGIRVFGETYAEPGDVLAFIYPSPWAAERYVYVVVPARPLDGPVPALNPASTWDLAVWSDWVVRRRATGRRGSAVDGVFDARWRLQEMPGTLLQPRPMNWE